MNEYKEKYFEGVIFIGLLLINKLERKIYKPNNEETL